jgi:hypothetical protein
MGNTAKATIAAVVAGYTGGNADHVLAQFHDDIRVVGSKAGESWHSKSEVEGPLRDELGNLEFEGELTELTEEALAEKIRPSNHNNVGLGWVTEEVQVVFAGQTVNGRWTCVVEKVGQGDWKVVQSHFSVPEAAETLS